MDTDRQHRTGPDPDTSDRRPSAKPIILPVFDNPPPRVILDTAVALAEFTADELLLVKVVAVPEQTPLELTDTILDEHHQQLTAALEALPATDRPTRGVVRVGHRRAHILASAVDEHDGSTTVVERPDSETSAYRPLRPPLVEAVGTSADCDVVAGGAASTYEDVTSILVPIAGGPHSECAIRVAHMLATYHDAWLELLHIIPEDAGANRVADGERYLATEMDRIGTHEDVDTWLYESDDVAATIIEQSAYYDITVLGAPQKGRLRQFVSGATTADVERGAENTVLTVCKNGDGGSCLQRWLGRGT
jgi:nucleotide-binding universal stress UspA family protein